MGYQDRSSKVEGRPSPRLARLVESGLCPAEKAKEYTEELRMLAREMADERLIRRSSKFFKALSDPTRLKILRLLTLRNMCVCEIMVALEMTQPTVSHHLNILEGAGLVTKRRQGKWIFHSLANPQIMKMLDKADSVKS